MYPLLRDGVKMGTFSSGDSAEKRFYVSNNKGEDYEVSLELFQELSKADGTRHLNLSRKVVGQLKKYRIITTSRFVVEGFINRYIVLIIGNSTKPFESVFCLMNILLPYCATVIFILGVVIKAFVKEEANVELCLPLYYGLLIASLAAHECGHLISAISAGYQVTDIGILLLGIFPIGAYTTYQEGEHAAIKQKIQVSLSGIEMNLLLAGVFLLLSVICPWSGTLVMIANVNIVLVLLNSIPAFGLDGEALLNDVFNVESISRIAYRYLLKKRKRRELLRLGHIGWMYFVLFVFIFLVKFVVILMIIGNTVRVIVQIVVSLP